MQNNFVSKNEEVRLEHWAWQNNEGACLRRDHCPKCAFEIVGITGAENLQPNAVRFGRLLDRGAHLSSLRYRPQDAPAPPFGRCRERSLVATAGAWASVPDPGTCCR